jgi:hypothetical protein
MKLTTQQIFLMTLVTSFMLMTADPLMAEVYKTVDEDGNVSYTDRPPGDGAKPMDLPPLSIVETPVYEKTAREAALTASAATGEQNTEIPLKTLRRTYRDFAIISPLSEESVWHPEQAIPVAWSVSSPLEAGMTVTLFIDGKKQAATTQPIIPVAGLERGEHTLTAELKDSKNRKIATAQPVTFFIRQPNIYTNRVRPRG